MFAEPRTEITIRDDVLRRGESVAMNLSALWYYYNEAGDREGLQREWIQGTDHMHARGAVGGHPMTDPIVDEVRRARDAHAARFNYDLDAIFQDIKKREAECGLVFVQGVARQPAPKQRMPPTGVAIPLPTDAKSLESAPAAER